MNVSSQSAFHFMYLKDFCNNCELNFSSEIVQFSNGDLLGMHTAASINSAFDA